MKRSLLFILLVCQMLSVVAQKNAPKWFDKQRKAILSITTYGADNKLLHTGTGFFVNETGEVLSAYHLFKGAERATATDIEGKVYPITRIIGADDMYDVIKVKTEVTKKVAFLSLAAEPLSDGAVAYLIPYTQEKNGRFKEGTITEVTKLKGTYSYYKINIPADEAFADAPLLTANGEVFGLAQEDASGKKEHCYGVSTRYINSLQISSIDMLNAVYTAVHIQKAWPVALEQAEVMLYLCASQQDKATYLNTLNDFIASFPTAASGYQNRASYYAYNRETLGTPAEQASYLKKAMADLEAAMQYDPDKASGLFHKAELIFSVAMSDTTLNDPAWSVPAAMALTQRAIQLNDVPLYRQLEAEIYYTQGNYEQAYQSYMVVNNTESATSATLYWAAKAKEQVPGANLFEILNLITLAVDKSLVGPASETMTYLLERVDYRMKLMQYEEAIADYDMYYDLANGKVNDTFYYYREQAKFRKGDMPGAMEDIRQALKLTPADPAYLAEEASIYIRLEKYDDALKSIQAALALAPDFAACYRLQGICYIRGNKKSDACTSFNKAKELGDPMADRLIKEHCQ